MTLISTRDSAHDFIVKFSPSMGVAVVASLTCKMAARSFAYHAHGTTDSDKSDVIHGLCANQQYMLAQAGTPKINSSY